MRVFLTLFLLALPLAAQTTDVAPRGLTSVTFANLGTPADGTIVYCSDCQSTNPTLGSGSGAIVRRENGAWNSGGSGGTGCIPAGSAGQIITDSGSGSCTSNAAATYAAGAVTLGTAGSVVGAVKLNNATTGTITVQPVTGALGTVTLSLPAATDTLIAKATTDTLTNKTFDTAGTGNSLQINGTAITAVSGTGAVCLASGSACNSGSVSVIASGTAALGTSAISSGSCATVVSSTATGTLTTDNIMADFNADPTGTTGYIPTTNGMLAIIKYPTVDHANFKVCNNTTASVTPGAITLNWRVIR